MASPGNVESIVPTRRLKVLGVAACGVLVFMLVVGQLAALHLLALQDRAALIIDLAGRQRRLCEALGTSALFIQSATSLLRRTQYVKEFQDALSLLERSVQRFQQREVKEGLQEGESRSFAPLFRKIDSHYQSLVAASSALLVMAAQADTPSTALVPSFENFAVQKETFLNSLDELVTRHEQLVKASRNDLRIGGLLGRGIALVGMCCVGFLVFRPILRKVAEQAEALTRTRDELKAEIAERDRVDDALRKSEERYRVISEMSIDYAFAFRFADDGAAYFEWLTPSFSRLTGYTIAEMLKEPNPWRLYIHPDDLPPLQSVEAKWTQGQPSVKEFRILTKSGEVRWVRSYTRPILNEQGTVLRVWGATQNITEYKQAEAALRESQERFDLVMCGVNDGIWDWNIITGEVYYSPRYKALLGYADHEFASTFENWKNCIHPEEVEAVLSAVQECVTSHTLFDREMRLQMKNGEYRWFQVRGRIVSDRDGKPVRAAGSLRDVTERKVMEAMLRKSEKRFRTLATASPVGIFQTDASGAGIYTNPRWQEIAGVEEKDTLGLGWADVISPEDREAVKTEWETCARQGREYAGEFRLARADGQVRWVSSRAVPLCSESNEVLGYVGTMEDITEQKKAREALQQAKEAAEAGSKAKSEFLANMSHELRTPMNGVIGMTNLLLESDLSPEQRDLAETAKTSAESLLTILNDILDFSKIEAGRLALDPRPFTLRALLDGVLKTFMLQAAEKNVALRCLVSPDIPDVFMGDSGRIRQILINLVGNALKFTDRGEVMVEVKKARRQKWTVEEDNFAEMNFSSPAAHYLAEFVVRDTGIGISQEQQRTIFDTFIQADASTTRRYGGTGLGLSICRKLTELMGGEIWVESEVRQGSTFHFTIRLRRLEEASEAVKKSPVQNLEKTNQTTRALDGKRILLAEDNAVNRKLAMHLLRKLGCEVVVAHHGKEAMLILERQEPFDALLMDCQMPEMDGFETTAAIRAREQRGRGNQCTGENGQPEMRSSSGELTTERRGCIHLPIIAMTANAMNGDRERCLAAGMDDYIAKPIRPVELQIVLERWLLTTPLESSITRVVGEQL